MAIRKNTAKSATKKTAAKKVTKPKSTAAKKVTGPKSPVKSAAKPVPAVKAKHGIQV